MLRRWLWALLFLLFMAAPVFAETVHLNSGEVIKGKILRADDEVISIETEKGFGVIQVKRSDIIYIQFDQNERDISRKFGLGFFHRIVPLVVESNGQIFGLDAVSFKLWFSKSVALDFLLGFTSVSTGGATSYEAMTIEARGVWVFAQHGSMDLYLGGAFGILTLTRSAGRAEESGTSMQGFLGTEVFLPSFPNLGIATEIGISLQEIGSGATAIKSTAIIPSVAVRYYF